jgi:secretion/DNA translocation related TadE-like protein
MAGVLMMLGAALAVVGAMVVAHRQAQASADLAGAGGSHRAATGADPCQAARDIATPQRRHVVVCAVDGGTVTVEVRVPGPHWLGQQSDLDARSRAGPAP